MKVDNGPVSRNDSFANMIEQGVTTYDMVDMVVRSFFMHPVHSEVGGYPVRPYHLWNPRRYNPTNFSRGDWQAHMYGYFRTDDNGLGEVFIQSNPHVVRIIRQKQEDDHHVWQGDVVFMNGKKDENIQVGRVARRYAPIPGGLQLVEESFDEIEPEEMLTDVMFLQPQIHIVYD